MRGNKGVARQISKMYEISMKMHTRSHTHIRCLQVTQGKDPKIDYATDDENQAFPLHAVWDVRACVCVCGRE